MMKINLTIVIPTHLKSPIFADCLQSVSDQARAQLIKVELIVVDNSPSPHSVLDLGNLNHEFCNARVIFSGRGVNSARNAGLASASSEIVLFLDDDCVLRDSSVLDRHIDFHKTHADVFAAGGEYLVSDSANFIEREYVRSQQEWLLTGRSLETQEAHFLLGGNFSLKRDMALKFGIKFDEAIVYGGSETEFFVHAKSLGLKSFHIEAPVSHDCRMDIFDYCRKAYKQGQGKAYREVKWGLQLCRSIYISERRKYHSSQTSGSVLDSWRRWLLMKLQFFIFMRGYKNEFGRKSLPLKV